MPARLNAAPTLMLAGKPLAASTALPLNTNIGKVDAESSYLFTNFREHTYRVPQPALVKNAAEGFTVLVMRDGKAEEISVDVLNYDSANNDALIEVPGAALRKDEAVIISTEEGLSAAAVSPGSSVAIPLETAAEPEASQTIPPPSTEGS